MVILILIASGTYYYEMYLQGKNSPSSQSPTTSSSGSQSQTPTISTDLNWGGYAVAIDFNNPQPVITAVTGSWVVPRVESGNVDTFSAIWVGIGGTFGNTLIQTGTEQDCVNGVAYYSAWFELLPSDSVTIPTIDVSPGDEINSSITLMDPNADLWSVSVSDLTSGQSYSQNFVYAAKRLSAEWVVERPDINNALSALANFGFVTMSNCRTVVEGCPGNIGEFTNVQDLMVNRQRTPLVEISNLSIDGSSFSVKYLQSQ